MGRGGEIGGRVAVSALAYEQEEEGDDDDGEGSFHGWGEEFWRKDIRWSNFVALRSLHDGKFGGLITPISIFPRRGGRGKS